MAQPPPYADGGGADGGPEREPGKPRWVTVLGILIAVIVIALFVYLHLAGILGPGAH
jgi:hypothetical protein